MNFVTELSLVDSYDVVLNVVDKLLKERHYISCKVTDENTFVKSTA